MVAAVAAACKKYGLALGLYYSLWDRSEPRYTRDFAGEYIPYMQAQLTELMDGRYGPIAELWLDGGWDKARSQWRLEELYDLVKRLQPECQIGINHTVGVDTDTAGGPDERYLPVRCRNGDPLRMFPCDFRLWDPHPCRPDDAKLYTFGGETYYLPFEMTVCSREGFSWFYSNIYEQKPLLDTEQVVHQCRDAWQAGNPVVINLPPDVRGRLVQADVEHLLEIARRLGVRRE
ncbi:alpha-L-fucosidase [Fournierella sp.]|uniref:alpha-L-fucosidase n=1 Tax=Allofournierella sp. TaxID=1940256 RepID=UPI0025BC12ED|nr:alpha-L-fucosidase [Fournierella sp.]